MCLLYFSLSFSPISFPIFSLLFNFNMIPCSHPLLYISPIYLSLIKLSPFSLPYMSSMSPLFCNPIIPWTSLLQFLYQISLPEIILPVPFSRKKINFFSPWNFTPAISVPDISLLHFLSRHFIPRNLFLIYDDFTFNPQPPTFYQRENCPMFFLHEALVLSAFPTYFYKSAAQ